MKKLKKVYNRTFVEAHRGASGYYYMNTMEAFDEAVRLKSDAIELDIRRTQDDKIIVVHDPLFNGKHINNWEYDELCKATTASEQSFIMPLLQDVLIKYKGKIILDIEVKEVGYEKEIVDLILKYLTLDEFYIRTFHEEACRNIKEYNKDVYCILLIGFEKVKLGFLGRLPELFPRAKIKRSKCDAVSPNYQLLRFGYVKRMHMRGQAVYAWTCNDEKVIYRMLKIKVDGIVGNYPDKIFKCMEEFKNKK